MLLALYHTKVFRRILGKYKKEKVFFQDLPAAVRRVAKFLDKNFTDDELAKLCEHLSIENFKNNKSVNYDVMKELGISVSGEQGFIRKGTYVYMCM